MLLLSKTTFQGSNVNPVPTVTRALPPRDEDEKKEDECAAAAAAAEGHAHPANQPKAVITSSEPPASVCSLFDYRR